MDRTFINLPGSETFFKTFGCFPGGRDVVIKLLKGNIKNLVKFFATLISRKKLAGKNPYFENFREIDFTEKNLFSRHEKGFFP